MFGERNVEMISLLKLYSLKELLIEETNLNSNVWGFEI